MVNADQSVTLKGGEGKILFSHAVAFTRPLVELWVLNPKLLRHIAEEARKDSEVCDLSAEANSFLGSHGMLLLKNQFDASARAFIRAGVIDDEGTLCLQNSLIETEEVHDDIERLRQHILEETQGKL